MSDETRKTAYLTAYHTHPGGHDASSIAAKKAENAVVNTERKEAERAEALRQEAEKRRPGISGFYGWNKGKSRTRRSSHRRRKNTRRHHRK